MLEITGVNLVKFVQEVYNLSEPVGMGFLHFKPEPLPENEASKLIRSDTGIAVTMDYVHGRCCKMHVYRAMGGRLFVDDRWYDHGEWAQEELFNRCGITPVFIEREAYIAMKEQYNAASQSNQNDSDR